MLHMLSVSFLLLRTLALTAAIAFSRSAAGSPILSNSVVAGYPQALKLQFAAQDTFVVASKSICVGDGGACNCLSMIPLMANR